MFRRPNRIDLHCRGMTWFQTQRAAKKGWDPMIQRWHTAFAGGALFGTAVTLIIQWLFWT